MMKTMTRGEAKRQLRQKLGDGLTLTPEVAKLIVAAGGPTFRTVSGGYRCNQTGEKVGRGGTENYRRRVHGLASPPKPIVAKTAGNRARKPVQSSIPTVDITNPSAYISCPNPHCRRQIGYARNMTEGVEACSNCNRQFRKIRLIVRADNAIRTKPSPTGGIYCPHCHQIIGHTIRFSSYYKTIACCFCDGKLIVE